MSSLKIHTARYGVSGNLINEYVDVVERLQGLVVNDSLDIVVNNSTLTPGQNPFRGKKKRLLVRYSIDGGEVTDVARDEKDWLIIGPVRRELKATYDLGGNNLVVRERGVVVPVQQEGGIVTIPPMAAVQLNDYLIRKFQISPQRLRGPMPIELRDFHRNDLAQLFAELGFKRGAEIGVAEGHYSEILLKANPECELLLVDPWHHYSDNPQGKSKEKHEFAYRETLRKTQGYRTVVMKDYSMNAVRGVTESSLDFCYIDAQHQFDYVMQDLIEWSKRVRSGGIVSGDDYYALDEKRWGAGPVEAVQAYVKAHRIPIWFICDADRSVDFFWVKS